MQSVSVQKLRKQNIIQVFRFIKYKNYINYLANQILNNIISEYYNNDQKSVKKC